MKISQVVIHEIKKAATETSASIMLSKSSLNVLEENLIKLLTDLDNRYKKKTQRYCKFNKSMPSKFYSNFENYCSTKSKDKFLEFTIESTKDLKTRIEGIQAAKGGYLIFAEYENSRKYVAVFIVRNTNSVGLSEELIEEQFNISLVKHVDVDNLAMACRINLNTFITDETRYLSLIHSQSDDFSNYFIKWIEIDDSISNEEDSKQLVKLLKIIPTPIDAETGNHIERDVFLTNIYKDYKASSGGVINLRNLSSQLYGDEDFIINYATENNYVISHEFKGQHNILKKLIQISVKADNIELSFNNSDYPKKVRIDANDPNLIIIESKNLAQEIKNQISNEN